MENKVKLNVLGLSYSQAQTGAYALILSDVTDQKRIPIVIGAAEAQSIAIIMEKMVTPRPLTHDLFTTFCEGFTVSVTEINIYRLDEGIFYSEIICKNEKTTVRIDARTSDAVAIALRAECPIYTNKDILDKAGIIMSEKELSESNAGNDMPIRGAITQKEIKEEEKDSGSERKSNLFSGYTLAQLKEMMDEAVLNEDYERASLLRDEMSKRD